MKNYFKELHQREMILSQDNVLAFNIKRDFGDALVSQYFHLKGFQDYKGFFQKYYWTGGRLRAEELRKYHELWDSDYGNVFVLEYEDLINHFDITVKRIGELLNVKLNNEDIRRIKDETTIERLREKRGDVKGRFFRKGIIGDSKKHFEKDMIRDLENIKLVGLENLGLYDKLYAFGKKLMYF